MNEILNNTIYPIQGSNKLFFDYPKFKQFASNENYMLVVNHILETIEGILKIHQTFEIHVNLFSFSASCLAKHKEFLRIFAGYSTMFDNKLTDFCVYYTPSIMDLIYKIISTHLFHRDGANAPKMLFYSKKESENVLNMIKEKNT
jgi:hypothetical protein